MNQNLGDDKETTKAIDTNEGHQILVGQKRYQAISFQMQSISGSVPSCPNPDCKEKNKRSGESVQFYKNQMKFNMTNLIKFSKRYIFKNISLLRAEFSRRRSRFSKNNILILNRVLNLIYKYQNARSQLIGYLEEENIKYYLDKSGLKQQLKGQYKKFLAYLKTKIIYKQNFVKGQLRNRNME